MVPFTDHYPIFVTFNKKTNRENHAKNNNMIIYRKLKRCAKNTDWNCILQLRGPDGV